MDEQFEQDIRDIRIKAIETIIEYLYYEEKKHFEFTYVPGKPYTDKIPDEPFLKPSVRVRVAGNGRISGQVVVANGGSAGLKK